MILVVIAAFSIAAGVLQHQIVGDSSQMSSVSLVELAPGVRCVIIDGTPYISMADVSTVLSDTESSGQIFRKSLSSWTDELQPAMRSVHFSGSTCAESAFSFRDALQHLHLLPDTGLRASLAGILSAAADATVAACSPGKAAAAAAARAAAASKRPLRDLSNAGERASKLRRVEADIARAAAEMTALLQAYHNLTDDSAANSRRRSLLASPSTAPTPAAAAADADAAAAAAVDVDPPSCCPNFPPALPSEPPSAPVAPGPTGAAAAQRELMGGGVHSSGYGAGLGAGEAIASLKLEQ